VSNTRISNIRNTSNNQRLSEVRGSTCLNGDRFPPAGTTILCGRQFVLTGGGPKMMNTFMSKPFHISRRSFLHSCAATAASAGLPLWFVQRELARAADQADRSPGSANDRPGVALIGCGGMGGADLQAASRYGNVVALCDVKQAQTAALAQKYGQNGPAPFVAGDFRRILERKDVDIVVNATPDHWHSLINIAAAKAKKDIYGEKPLTLTIDEGKHVVKAIRDNKVVFQTGTQQRSDRFRLACELVRNGRIGKLKTVEVFVPAGLREGPFDPHQAVPPGVDWDMWLGQAPKVDYMKERCGNTFRWWWEYAGGPVTDWGAHHNDIARWAIGQDGPESVEARTTVGPIEGGFNTCKEFEATLMWANDIQQIVKTTVADSPFGGIIDKNGQRNGLRFTGTDGWIWVNRGDLTASRDDIYQTPLPDNALKLEVSGNHMGNFIDCVKSRKDPIARVEEGHRSACIGHLIIIALHEGRKLTWDPAKEQFTGDGAKEGNAHLAREMRKPYDYTFVS
jgi:predicted dehydrogenase